MNQTPRLLLSTAPFYRYPLREAFRHAREAGFEAVEVMVTSDPATQDARSLSELADEFGLRIGALHAPFLLLFRRVWGADPVGKIYRATQVAESADIPLVVVHPPFKWQVRFRQWVDASLAEYSARAGITIGVENMFPLKLRGDRGLRFHASQDFEDLDRYPQLVLDTSHVANNAGRGWDSHLPVDEGILPLADLLDEVATDAFGGTMALELDLRSYLGDDEAVREGLARNRKICERR